MNTDFLKLLFERVAGKRNASLLILPTISLVIMILLPTMILISHCGPDRGGMTMKIEKPAWEGSGGSGRSLDEIAVQGGAYTQSSLIQWFGEVATANGIPPHTDMGDGLIPSNVVAANSTLCDVNAAGRVCRYRDRQSLGAAYTPYYDINRTSFGQTLYGGPGE